MRSKEQLVGLTIFVVFLCQRALCLGMFRHPAEVLNVKNIEFEKNRNIYHWKK